MAVLIGVLIFVAFVTGCILGLRKRIREFSMKYFNTPDIKSVIDRDVVEEVVEPKSLSSMDSIYLDQINKDFPGININELKSMCKDTIFSMFKAINAKDSELVEPCVRKIVESKIADAKEKDAKYSSINIHKVVVSKYENNKGVATIHFGCSFEYYYSEGKKEAKRIQDRAMIDFVYVIDENIVEPSLKLLGLNCPNCGSPLTNTGVKVCSYCKTSIVEFVKRVWTCNGVKFY